MALRGRNFHYVADKEVKTTTKCEPWCHSNLQQNACGVRVQVEWGINGLKRKWRHLLMPQTKIKVVFIKIISLNYIDFPYKVIKDHNSNQDAQGGHFTTKYYFYICLIFTIWFKVYESIFEIKK